MSVTHIFQFETFLHLVMKVEAVEVVLKVVSWEREQFKTFLFTISGAWRETVETKIGFFFTKINHLAIKSL